MMIVTKGKQLRISYMSWQYNASLAPYLMSLSAEFLSSKNITMTTTTTATKSKTNIKEKQVKKKHLK